MNNLKIVAKCFLKMQPVSLAYVLEIRKPCSEYGHAVELIELYVTVLWFYRKS